MPFKFFRPWEDGGKDSTHKKTDQHQGSPCKAPETRKAPIVQSCQSLPPQVCCFPSKETITSLQLDDDTSGLLSALRSTGAIQSDDGNLEITMPVADKTCNLVSLLVQDSPVHTPVNPACVSRSANDPGQPGKTADFHRQNSANKTVLDKDNMDTSLCTAESGGSESDTTLQYSASVTNPTHKDAMPNFSTQCAAEKHFSSFGDSDTCGSLVPFDDAAVEKDFQANTHDMVADMRESHGTIAERTSDDRFNYKETLTEQDYNFTSKAQTKDLHKDRSNDVKCMECDKSFSDPMSLQGHTSTNNPPSFFMFEISKKTSSKLGIICRHEVNQKGCKPYWCDICEKTFSSSNYLQTHKRTHTGSKPFQCRICDKTFMQSCNLHTHERIHTGSKPFQCRICDRALTHCSTLRTHERTHTGSKPFQCRICDRAFSQSSTLRRHERIHTGSKPFQCLICKKTFSRSSNLQTHKRTHTSCKPFSCRICDKAFSQSSNLKKHEHIHTGSKPFQCVICAKTFSASSNLRTHERIHNGSRPYNCKFCEKAFSQSSHLHKHQRIHTGSKLS